MTKVVITPGITDLNRGDQALIWLIKDILKEGGVTSDIKLLQSGNSLNDIYMQSKQSIEMGFDVITPVLLHPARKDSDDSIKYTSYTKIKWGFTALKDLVYSSLLLSKVKIINRIGESRLSKDQMDTYTVFSEMDIMIVKGGGFLHTYKRLTDIYYLYYSLFNIMLAQRLSKKVIIMPNSFGPFLGKFEKYFVKRVLKKCNLIYARENISKKYLSDLLDKEIHLSPDLGFYIPVDRDDGLTNTSVLSNKGKTVAITMRPYRFPEYSDGEKRYQNYINEMFIVCRELIKGGYYPIFVAHTLGPSAHEDDRIALNSVIEKLEDYGISTNQYTFINDSNMNCFDVTNLYSQIDYIIGTRFHSVIFSMVSLTPAIAISYSGHKTTGIMKDMGLEDYVIDIGELKSENILSKFYYLVDNKSDVKKKIKKYLDYCCAAKEEIVKNTTRVM